MRGRLPRTRLLLTLAALLGLSVGAAPATQATPADRGTALPIAYHCDLAVDARHKRVFISDYMTGSVLVADYQGRLISTIKNLPGVCDLELSADSRTLYAPLALGDAISVIDTGTARQRARHATGAGSAPFHAALSGRTLFFGYGEQWEASIGSLSLGTATPKVRLGLIPEGDFSGAPLLATSPAAPGTLVAGEQNSTPGHLSVYDVSGTSPVLRKTVRQPGGSSSFSDLAITPDGKTLLTASGAPYRHLSFRLPDLAEGRTYPSTSYPNSVAVSARGDVAAGVNSIEPAPDVYLYRSGAGSPYRTVSLAPATGYHAGYLRPRGLAWAPDGTRLFAISGHNDEPNLRLVVVPSAHQPKAG
ncbi:lactonase family protein [Streptomyces uncialis]|uniref:lactonase family protein n=1 Tax=Streptomyces uncialis TaxID=1048205 RepID=UPI000AF71EF6|nr:lactonase family protein [Streptomyces uncialis]WTE15288.1 lactonase family protein [Streptomyces uncialis]